ncbi:pentapeptide repeat-containing protein [Actinomadura litoris]|uniref:pentapeptide repeat-containing protein n=1 Tax=Actinomadura litoris TaxID=2678616 RepID=UPI001FA72518|nr:pentapeptide repeat-containing protein [Actinomadura litoris]
MPITIPPGCPEESLRPSASQGELCGAIPAVDGGCLAHLSPDQLQAHLADLAPGADIDAHGVVFTADLLQRLLRATADRSLEFGNADFSEATFTERVSFSGATFTKDASFDHTTFLKGVSFSDTTFTEPAVFIRAGFSESTDFTGARFTADVDFAGAAFTDGADFSCAAFSGGALFSGVRVEGRMRLMACAVQELVWSGARISGELEVEAAAARVDLSGVRASERVDLRLRGA